jgi:hypothetical protein
MARLGMVSDVKLVVDLYKQYTGYGMHGKRRYNIGTMVHMYITIVSIQRDQLRTFEKQPCNNFTVKT